jgi:D-alanyl-D-alanine dipeptidase
MKWIAVLFVFLVGCSSEVGMDHSENKDIKPSEDKVDDIDSVKLELDIRTSEIMAELGLVDIQKVNPKLLIDLKYATNDNFMKMQLYDTLVCVFLQRDVALRLSKCQDLLDSIKPGYRLLVFDGVRPVQVQREMWNALDTIPKHARGKYVSNPALGSLHNFGAAVDLTIVDSMGNALDMGAGYDDFRDVAFPKYEARFLKSGELTEQQVNNRKLLRTVMRSQRFYNIPSEWWHFNALNRVRASHKYQLLISESGEAKWFKIIPKDLIKTDSVKIKSKKTI